jgi:hypothetical protein
MKFEITKSGEYFTVDSNTAPPGEPRNGPWTLFARIPPYPLQVATVGFYTMTEFLPDVSAVAPQHVRRVE